MKYFVTLILCSISLCKSEDFVCQLFDEKTKLFEYYCKYFDGTVPNNCSASQFLVESLEVNRLKVGGCYHESVSYAIKSCQNIQTLDISHSGFKSLDSFELQHKRLQIFNASHNELSMIQQEFFANVPELIELDLAHNQLDTVRSFVGVEQLQRIHLSHNNIDSIADDAFMNLTRLEYMDLSNNKINRIKANLYSNLVNLQILHLENNSIDTFHCENLLKMKRVAVYMTWKGVEFLNTDCEEAPLEIVVDSEREGFFPTANGKYEIHCSDESLENIVSFTAGHNQFENIVELMQCFGSSIVGLYLDGNFIGRLDAKFPSQRFTDLKELSMRGTGLTEFDFTMLKNQKQLRTLDISTNHLKHVNIFSLAEILDNLIEFSAAQNQFENVTEIIQYLTPSIKTLDLSSNYVGRLNVDAFDRLKGLEVLNLSNTSLSIRDFSPFDQLESLETLDVSYNDLSMTHFDKPNATTFDRYEHLRTLNLSHTHLPISDFQPFQRYGSLETLDISHNNLRTMNFTRLSIKILDLSGNFLGEINTNTFERLKNLIGLKLSNTSLSISDTNPFESLRRLAVLDISKNNLEKVDFKILSTTLNKLFGFQAINCHIKNASGVIQQLGPTLMALDLSENFVGHLNVDKFKTLHLYSLHLTNASISKFDYNALNLGHLRSLKLSYNQLQTIDFRSNSFSENVITELNLEGNDLVEIKNLNRLRFKWLRSLAISKNRLSCECLTQIIREWNGKFIGDPWDQKHGEDCHYMLQSPNTTQTESSQ